MPHAGQLPVEDVEGSGPRVSDVRVVVHSHPARTCSLFPVGRVARTVPSSGHRVVKHQRLTVGRDGHRIGVRSGGGRDHRT